jgi:(2Fe-2S) ferredoxin
MFSFNFLGKFKINSTKSTVYEGYFTLASVDWAYEGVSITYSGCIGPCDQGANVLVYPEGVLYRGVTPEDVAEIFTSHLEGGQPVERLLAPASVW